MERGAERRPTSRPTSAALLPRSSRGCVRWREKLASRSREPLGRLALGGAPVVETQKAYGCSAWKTSGCDFAIWKQVSASA